MTSLSTKHRVLVTLMYLASGWPLSALGLGQGDNEGEFSPGMLAHKLHLLNCQFELTESGLTTRSVAESKLMELDQVFADIKRLEAEFRGGRYYPDLLDEQIVIAREELRLIAADPRQATPDNH
jgi:hypothetical protein